MKKLLKKPYLLVFVFWCVVIASIFLLRGKISGEKFESQKWKTANMNSEENWSLRWDMMNSLRNNYELKGMTKDEMRIAIRNERRIEMAFEEQRFWDLRRWKTAETALNKDLNGMIITRNATTGALTYQKAVVGKISFANPRMYFYPIPYAEITKNTNLVQNTGW